MALATQCPHCHTTFRVAHDQLKLRAGMVRCGQCRQVFNGIEHLLPPTRQPTTTQAAHTAAAAPIGTEDVGRLILPGVQNRQASTPTQAPADAEIRLQSGGPVSVPVSATVTPVPDNAAPAALPEPNPADVLEELDYGALEGMTLINFPQEEQSSDRDDWYLAADPAPNATGPGLVTAEAAPRTDEASEPAKTSDTTIEDALPADTHPTAAQIFENDAQEPSFVTASRRRQHRNRQTRMLFGIGSIILALALLAQAGYALRHQIAAHLPQAKPALLDICRVLGCSIKLPAQIDAITIESSDLQAQSGAAGTLALTLLLRNRASTAQAWPNIELTLNDGNQRAVLRRVFTPREFPVAAAGIAAGFAADSEQSIRLPFTLTQLKAAGYRVVLFYP
ncbi:MAG: DUF3426 domain-containing protein [Glaciimonas sp.]|nr:DUF3426 domain-containing protein [Glaciimonas sp.]